MSLLDIVAGLFTALECFLPLYAILLSWHYMVERDKAGDITYTRFVMLLLCTFGFAVMGAWVDFGVLFNILRIVSFAIFSVLGLVTLVKLGLNMYQKENKHQGSVVVAVLIALYVCAVVFVPRGEREKEIQKEAEFPDPDYYISGNVTDDYHDGFVDGFADGYAAAFKELTGENP